jgi:pimeloyl-ACP methyl ester carboxylesterase
MRNLLAVLGLMVGCMPVLQAEFSVPAQSVDFEGQRVLFHLQGQPERGTVMVLGGGPGFSSWNLEPVQTIAARLGYRTVIMDMFGVGENKQALSGPVLPVWVSQIETVRERIGGSSLILIGHSWGALMAMRYTQAYPERVSKLILLNPVDPEKRALRHLSRDIHQRLLAQSARSWDDEQAWENALQEDLSVERLALRQIRQVLPTYFYDEALGRRYAMQFDARDFELELNVAVWKEYDQTPLAYATVKQWPQAWYFLGCREDYLMPYNLESMQAHIRFRQQHLLTPCGHFPWVEQPGAFARALKQMLWDVE